MDIFADCIKLNDLQFNYIKFGKGNNNLLILPGVSLKKVLLSKDAIADRFSFLCDSYTIYLIERKDDECIANSIEEFADNISAVLKALNINKISLYGVSRGGIIGQYMAIKYRDLVDKLFLVSTTSKMDDDTKKTMHNWIKLLDDDIDGFTKAFMYDLYTDETINAMGDLIIKGNIDASKKEAIRFNDEIKYMLLMETYEMLDQIKCKTMIVQGKNDKVFNYSHAIEISDKLNCPCKIIDNYGHGVYDETNIVLDYLKEFLLK